MAAKELPKIRAGMGDVEAPVVEAWDDDDFRRATGLGTILSADGKADRAGVPALEPAALRECYRTMLRIRALDERARARRHGELADESGDAAPGTFGVEAAIVGAVAALEADDIVVPGRRETGAALWRGHSVAALAAGAAIPRALGVLPGSAHGATQLPHAAGIAWAMKMQARPQARQPAQQANSAADAGGAGKLTLAYLDREATSAEDFHAGLNFAGVFRLPVVFLCINDVPAGDAPVETLSETLAVKALAYGIAGMRVDGSDLFAVFAATRAAVARARSGDGATLIEAVIAEGGDPLPRVRQWLASQDMLDAAAESALRHEGDTEVDVALATPR
jgi:2-oxoisovalerate dehydrogenase E1 component alpha subunit